jgi:hypothetical protein
MPQVESHRRDPERACFHLSIAKARAPQFDVLGSQFQRMQYLTRHSFEFSERSS